MPGGKLGSCGSVRITDRLEADARQRGQVGCVNPANTAGAKECNVFHRFSRRAGGRQAQGTARVGPGLYRDILSKRLARPRTLSARLVLHMGQFKAVGQGNKETLGQT